MQRGIGFSVQLPNDTSSLLHIHADVWDGDSPFEVVLWVPIVDCFRTKAMYLVPPAKDRPFQGGMHKYQGRDVEDLYQAVKDAAQFVPIKYGQVLLFSQTLMHGNRVNVEPETRWSMNCRFKSVLSPYADKKIGEFFEPITLRPATRIGLDYALPEGFQE
jgi:sporadic carbohydrate cluster 2OG-Fe(II) oxygenase